MPNARGVVGLGPRSPHLVVRIERGVVGLSRSMVARVGRYVVGLSLGMVVRVG